jgi:hypothetical protein
VWSQRVRNFFELVLIVVALGALGWCAGLLVGALLLLVGLSEATADHAPAAGFVLGVIPAAVTLASEGGDVLRRAWVRLSTRSAGTPPRWAPGRADAIGAVLL